MKLVEKVGEAFQSMSREDRNFAGGILYHSDIERQIKNYRDYMSSKTLPNRDRINFGICEFGKPRTDFRGYCAFTVLRDASPTDYEKELIKLPDLLSYVQIKNIFVPEEFRGTSAADNLFEKVKYLALNLQLNVCADIMKENLRAKSFFERRGMQELFPWKTKNNTEMIRLSLDNQI